MATYRSKRLERKRNNPYNGAEILKVHRRVFPRESIWPWVISISLLCIFVVVGIFTFSLVWSVESARDKASAAIDGAGEFLAAAKAGDQELLEQSASNVSDAAHGIKDELNGSIWELAALFPVIGTDVEDIRILAEVLTDVADNALVPMAESGNILALKDLAKDDSIDFSALPGLLVALDEAMPALNRCARTLESLPPASIPPLASVLNSATDKIVTVDDFVTRIRPLFPYLPEMFGADGRTRNYLILAQNNAEIHAIGGFVGALGMISVTNGKIEVGDFASLQETLTVVQDAAGATEEEIKTFGERCDTHHGDHNIIPDFQRVGQLYFNIWNYYHDQEIDGVLGLDPVFLQYLLTSLGSIDTSYGVSVDGTNCAAIMLNQSLFWWKPHECDLFYNEVAKEALSRIMGNLDKIDLSAFLHAVTRAGDEGRCMFWVRDEEMESALQVTGFAGELKHDSGKPELGVYISDASTSKMSFYLSNDIEVGEPTENSDGSQSYDVSVTIKNNFDVDANKKFPSYIKVNAEGRSRSDLFEEVHIIAPEGGYIENLTSERVDTRGGSPDDSQWFDNTYQGLSVKSSIFRIDSKESVVIRFTVVTSTDAVESLKIRQTPLMPEEYAYWNEDISANHPEWTIEKTAVLK